MNQTLTLVPPLIDEPPEIVKDVAYLVGRYGYAEVRAELELHAPSDPS